MKQVAVLGSEEFRLGFELAGVGLSYPVPREAAEPTVRELMANTDIGLIIIEEKMLEELPEELRDAINACVQPVFLTITEEDTNEEMRKLIRKSIGVDLWNK